MGPYDNYPGLQPYYPPAPGGTPGYVPQLDPQVLAANLGGQLDALNRGQAESDRFWNEDAARQAWNQAQVNEIERPHDINPINVALAPLRILGGLIGGVRGALQGNVPYIGDTGFSPAQEISTVTGQPITQPQDSRGALGGVLDFLTGESARKDAAYRALGQSILRNYGIQWKQDEANANELLKRAQQLHDLAGSYSELQNSQSNLGKANAGIYQDIAQAAAARSTIPVNAAHAALLGTENLLKQNDLNLAYKYGDALKSAEIGAKGNEAKSHLLNAIKAYIGMRYLTPEQRLQAITNAEKSGQTNALAIGKLADKSPDLAGLVAPYLGGKYTPNSIWHWTDESIAMNDPLAVLKEAFPKEFGNEVLTDDAKISEALKALTGGSDSAPPTGTVQFPDYSSPAPPTINGSTEDADFAKLANQNPTKVGFIGAVRMMARKAGMNSDDEERLAVRAQAWGKQHPESFNAQP